MTQSTKRKQNLFVDNAVQNGRTATAIGIVIVNTMST